MATAKALDLSTAYIKQSTDELLHDLSGERDIEFPVRVQSHEYGHIIFCSSEWDEEDEAQLKEHECEELIPILKYAVENNIMLINFDGDGDDSETFQTFNW